MLEPPDIFREEREAAFAPVDPTIPAELGALVCARDAEGRVAFGGHLGPGTRPGWIRLRLHGGAAIGERSRAATPHLDPVSWRGTTPPPDRPPAAPRICRGASGGGPPMKTVLAIAAMAALGIGGDIGGDIVGGAWMLRTPPPEDRPVEACGATIRDRLKAPSTCTPIAAERYSCKPEGWERHLARDHPEMQERARELMAEDEDAVSLHDGRKRLNEGRPLARMSITCEAQNALGGPVRSTSECRVRCPPARLARIGALRSDRRSTATAEAAGTCGTCRTCSAGSSGCGRPAREARSMVPGAPGWPAPALAH